ncbi:hypothetical protein CAC42_295 [Sphaceloma murrayae]|uniref:NYN domain-containing protein n=1 Tax=Sphaceloma murrayae TaxID=2082308 RepID=A0A2K1QZV1_9PEZI|nr:hypothetical protein CAC42_295 [Sphaceloma murrayae]
MIQQMDTTNTSSMTTTAPAKAWDFSAVYSLLDTLANDSPKNGRERTRQRDAVLGEPLQTSKESSKCNNNVYSQNGGHDGVSSSLGDFSHIWQFLGTSTPTRRDNTYLHPNTSPTLQQRIPAKTEYTSDGAAYNVPASAKKLQWRDEVNDGTLTDVAPAASDGESTKLSKKQRKKLNRRRRAAQEEETRRTVSDMESEAEMPSTPRNPAARASIHSMPAQSEHGYKFRPRDGTGRVVTPQSSPEPKKTPKKQESVVAVPFSDKEDIPIDDESKSNNDAFREKIAEAGRKVLARYNSEPPEPRPRSPEKVVKKQWPVSNPYDAKALAFLPASVRPLTPKKHAQTTSPPASQTPPESTPAHPKVPATLPSKSRIAIQPITIRPPEDRHWALLLKLIKDFWSDKPYLVAPANLSNHSHDPSGIHVFVDASNILIGFHDALKRARGIPAHVRVPRVDISFDSLALLLERRRPVAKRVLAGSTPTVPAFEVARRVGYECAILDKVYKARELTDRQRYFLGQERERKRRGSRGKRSGGETDGEMSGASDSASLEGEVGALPTHAPEKFVEQGVDEILHLKMLESIVDADDSRPPSTIVLATGDAAKAEYSGGFMQMVERALNKGWRVELVSWRAGLNQLYLKREWRRKWGDKFRVIELEEYAEEMLEM